MSRIVFHFIQAKNNIQLIVFHVFLEENNNLIINVNEKVRHTKCFQTDLTNEMPVISLI